MMRKAVLPLWLTPTLIKSGLVIGSLLFLVSYSIEVILVTLHLPPSSTMLDNAAIAIVGTLIMAYYILSTQAEQVFLRENERMHLTIDLNHHVRSPLTAIHVAASLEDTAERLRQIDEAIAHIDQALFELVPAVGNGDAPQYSLRGRP